MEFRDRCYIIMSKDRKLVIRGVTRNRWMMYIGEKTKKRVMTYSSEKKAQKALKIGFKISDRAMRYLKEQNARIKTGDKFQIDELEIIHCRIKMQVDFAEAER